MKIKTLIYKEKEYSNPSQINKILSDNKFHWLISSEIEDAIIEIKNNTIIWHDGTFYSGTIPYIIWLNGNFKGGRWINGVCMNMIFSGGTFESGIEKNRVIKKVSKGRTKNDNGTQKEKNDGN